MGALFLSHQGKARAVLELQRGELGQRHERTECLFAQGHGGQEDMRELPEAGEGPGEPGLGEVGHLEQRRGCESE